MASPYAPPRSKRMTAHPPDDVIAVVVGTLVNGEVRTMAVYAGDPDEVAPGTDLSPQRAGSMSIRFEKFGDHNLFEIRGYVQDDVYAGDRRLPECAFDAYTAVGAAAIARVVRDRVASLGPVRAEDPDAEIRRLAAEVLRQGPPIDPTP